MHIITHTCIYIYTNDFKTLYLYIRNSFIFCLDSLMRDNIEVLRQFVSMLTLLWNILERLDLNILLSYICL